ncbi:MAG: Rho termination factor N-terminal domain-containing protein, partial [Alistipes finegoldii]
MQDLKALEGKSLAELHEIAKALGIEDVMVKKRELIEKITGGSAQETPAENKGKRGRKKETPAAETPAVTTPETAVAEAAAKTAETSAAEPEPMAAEAPAAPAKPRGRRPRMTKAEN